jgi:O-antigen/teichoic acid export membrane protein
MLRSFSVAYTHQAAIILFGLWLTPFLLRRIGQHDLGLWLVAGQVLGYLGLLDLGVIAILPREVAFATGRLATTEAQEHIARLVAQVRRIVRWQMLALSVTCALLWWFLPSEWAALSWPLAIVFIAFVALYPLRVAQGVLQGLQELPFIAKTQMLGWLLSTVLTILLVFVGFRLYALVLGCVVTLAVPGSAAWWRLRIHWASILSAGDSEQPVRHYFARSIWVSAGQIAQVLLAGSDVLLLGRILGPLAVVPYACTGKLVTVLSNHPQALIHAAQPALSELRGSDSREQLARVATVLTEAMLLMSGALVVIILAVNEYFVTWWVGAGQYGGRWLTIAFVAMMLVRHWNVATIFTLFCFGYERQLAITCLVDGLVTVLATVFGVWKWGVIAAPLGSIVSALLVSLPFNLRSVAQEIGMTPAVFLNNVAPVFARIVPIAAAAIIGSVWIGPSLVGVLLLTLIVLTGYLVATWGLVCRGAVGPYLREASAMLFRSRSRFTNDSAAPGTTRTIDDSITQRLSAG